MPSFFNHYFGIQDATQPALQEHTLQITDGDLVVDFAVYDCNYGVGECVPVPDNIAAGWALVGPSAWQMRSAGFKNGGYYANSMLAHGQMLRHTVFDNVTESFQAHLKSYSPDGMIQDVDALEELLLNRAPRYWTKRRQYSPVYLVRALPGESNLAYALLSQGSVLKPQNLWSAQCTLETGLLKPVLISFNRQPFWLGAAPGQVQNDVEVSALQNWEFQMSWAVESVLPTGYIYSFVETSTGDIFASGQSEILRWTNSAWSVISTAPVTLAENVTSSILLDNGDILFGGNGRIIKRTSSGTWEIETTLPTGQVNAMILTDTGDIYAGDNGNILIRDADDETWSVDSTLPLGFVYSFVQASDGNVFAGEEGRILKTTLSGGYGPETSFSRYSHISGTGSYDDAAEDTDGAVTAIGEPDALFARWAPWVGFRFQDVDIPDDAVIRSARLRFRSSRSRTSTGGQMRIYGERRANPGPFVESTSRSLGGSISCVSSPGGSVTINDAAPLVVQPPGTPVIVSGDWGGANLTSITADVSAGGSIRGTISGSGTVGLSQGLMGTIQFSGTVTGTLSGDNIAARSSISGNLTVTLPGPDARFNLSGTCIIDGGLTSDDDVTGTISLQANIRSSYPGSPYTIEMTGTVSGSGRLRGSYSESTAVRGLGTISGRRRTSASVLWTMNDEWLRTQDWRYRSPQLRRILQQIVNQSGWRSGNAVVFLLQWISNSPRYIRNHAYLDVTYVVPAPLETVWEVNTTFPSGDVRSLMESEISELLLAGEDGEIIGSDDLGKSWGVITTLPTNEVRALREIAGYTYAGDDGNILRSPDGGRTWSSQSALPTNYVHDFVYETATQDTRAGDNGNILWLDETEQVTLGMEETTVDDIFIVNHHKTCNLTHLVRASGGGAVFSSNFFPITAFPVALFGAPIVNNDAIYFGVDTSNTDSGPFCNLIFDLAQHMRGTVVVNWEYWNGANWVALSVHDETLGFSEPGVHGVFWEHPTDWATTAVDGVTGYWVRARLSAIAGTIVTPTQQNRTIYTCITPFVEIDRLQLGGNVDPIVQMRIHNRSDDGGPGGAYPDLYMNRVWIGAKETDGHENFRAYLNFADEQNPEGVTVDVTVDPDTATAIQDDTNLSSATGRRVFIDATAVDAGAGLDNWEDRVAIELDTTIARDFYGTYMPLLVCKQNGGSAGEVDIRLKVVSGTGGISKIGDTQITQSVTDHELIIFDSPLQIPVSSQMTDSDIGDETSIIIQTSHAANDADLYLYGLFLQPTDDAWIECEDTANTAESSLEDRRHLLIDSISIPKSPTRVVVQQKDTNAFVSTWHYDGNGPARIICKKSQKLWFHFARTESAGSSLWLSEPEACCSVTIGTTNRYIWGRGAD